MFKKFFTVTTLFFLLTSVVSAATLQNGSYKAKTNINVRNAPSAQGKRIGYFHKDDSITVTKVLGNWCQVEYRKYLHAYVYCPFLEQISQNNPVTINGGEKETNTVTYAKYSSEKYQYSFEYPRVFGGYLIDHIDEDYTFDPSLSAINQTTFDLHFDIYATSEQYKKLYLNNPDLEKIRSENFTSDSSDQLELDYFQVKSQPNMIIIAATYDKFPVAGNLFTITYNKNLVPDGETIFKHILNSARQKNNMPVVTYMDQYDNFLLQRPAAWQEYQFSDSSPLESYIAQSPNFLANVTVKKTKIDSALSSKDYADQTIQQEEDTYQFQEIKRNSIPVQKTYTSNSTSTLQAEIVWFTVKLKGTDKVSNIVQLFAVDGSNGYIVTGAYYLSADSNTQTALENTVRSFTIIPQE